MLFKLVYSPFLSSMTQKISADLLNSHLGMLGVWSKKKKDDIDEAVFETLWNFDFEIAAKNIFGSARGSGAIYRTMIPGEDAK